VWKLESLVAGQVAAATSSALARCQRRDRVTDKGKTDQLGQDIIMTFETENVAFQGEPGAYSEQAVREFFGADVKSLPCRGFRDIFEALGDGRASHGMLPVENSLAGTVIPAYDLLMEHDLQVQGEAIVRVEHCLMAPAGTPISDLSRVRSHHQALAQCEHTLRRMGLTPVEHYDTAGAARDLASNPEPGTAVIASALAAQTYGLDILVPNVEDLDFNYTRFFVLGKEASPRRDPSKTSIVFTTRHVPGALHAVMGELAARDLNLTKIESRPRRNRPWHYLFYVDFEGHEEEPKVRDALLGILKLSSFLKVLGSYPAAETAGPSSG
jgi:prephenate dehydratase